MISLAYLSLQIMSNWRDQALIALKTWSSSTVRSLTLRPGTRHATVC